MGCNISKNENKEEKQANEMIERELMRLKHAQKSEQKLLLLGIGESGKSTIFKQMKILSANQKFSVPELASYTLPVRRHLTSQMKILLKQAQQNHLEGINDESAQKIFNIREEALPASELAEDFIKLWQNPHLKELYQQIWDSNSGLIFDCSDYFFDNASRILQEDFIPSTEDVIRVRSPTTSINEAEFDVQQLHFKLVDVGGQRGQRKKWIHCFDDVDAVIFVVSLIEYDQKLPEDPSVNRMKESLELFFSICRSPWFKFTTFIIFFNKVDLFHEKINTVPLTKCFSGFPGPERDESAAKNYIQQRFEAKGEGRIIYPHFTIAIDTENVKFVFEACRLSILRRELGTYL